MQPVQVSRSSAFPRTSRFGRTGTRLFIFAALLLLAGAGDAWAKRKVAIIKFKGPQAAKIQKGVTTVIKSENSIVSGAKVAKAQKKLKATKLTSKNVKRLAASLEADVIVAATVKKKKGKLSVTVTVYEGASGQVVGDVPVAFKKLNDAALQKIAEGVLPLIAQVQEGGGEEVAEGPPPEEGGEGPPPEETAPPPEEVAAAGGEGEGEGEGALMGKSGGEGEGGEKGPDEGEPLAANEKWARHWSADVMGGVSFIGRKISFNYDAVDTEPWGYNGNPVPGVYVAADVYPMSFGGKKGMLANLGIGFMFDRVLSLKSKLRSGSEEFTTTQQRLGLEALYRWNLGSKPTSPTLRFSLGYQAITFAIDAPDLDLPNASYAMFGPGAGIRYPIGSPRLALFTDFKYLIVSSAGAMNEPMNYGGASMNGIDFDLGVEFRPFVRMPIRVGAQYTRIGYTFDGTGDKTTMRDADPDQDVGGASDTYFGGFVQAGYLF